MFSEDLARALKAKRLSVPTLADRTGLSTTYLYNILNGSRTPSAGAVSTLDRTLHFPAKVLVAYIRVDSAGEGAGTDRSRVAAFFLTALRAFQA